MPAWLRRAAPALVALWLVATAHQALLAGWFIEDAAISFAYARNLAEGWGPVPWPGGERIEAFSNPLWVALLAVCELVGISGFHAAKPLALLCTGWALVASCAVARRALPPERVRHAWIAPALLAAHSAFAMWATSGLESALFGALLLSAIAVQLADLDAGRSRASALWVLLALTRPEGVLYAGLGAALVLQRAPGRFPGWSAGIGLPLAALVGLRLAIFAWPLPMPFYAKVGTAGSKLWDPSSRGWVQLAEYLWESRELLWLPILGLGLLRARSDARWLIGGSLALAVGFSLWANGDWMRGWRWMSLAAPSATVLLAVGLAELADRVGSRGWSALLVPGLFLAAWTPTQLRDSLWFAREGRNESPHGIQRRVRYTRELADRLVLDEPVANLDVDMGAFLYWSDHRMVDLAGLVDVPIALHRFSDPGFVEQYLLTERRPHLAHLHGHWARSTGIADREDWRALYVELPPWPDGPSRMHGGEWIRRDLLLRPAWPGPPGRELGFQGGVRIAGWDLPGATTSPGRPFALALGIQTPKRLPGQAVALHAILVADGARASWEIPLEDEIAMHLWGAREVFVRRTLLELPADFPLGVATLAFELIGPDGSRSLQVAGEVAVVDRASQRRAALDTSQRAVQTARSGACAQAEALWREARDRLPRDRAWHEATGPSEALADCWVDRAPPEDPVPALARALRWSPGSRRVARAAAPVADRLFDEGRAALDAGEPQRAREAFEAVLRIQPTRAWARRYAEEARNQQLGLGPLPIWGRGRAR